MKKLGLLCLLMLCTWALGAQETIPLPEHPRPDFYREEWINLNGTWRFTFDFDTANEGIVRNQISDFQARILVPFPWGSKLSNITSKGNDAWYGRQVTVPESWRGKRIFLVIGASDWETRAWFNGASLGVHQGGYTPFEFELTQQVEFGKPQNLIIGVEDNPSSERLRGKQGYGDARGIWQTVYLEARGTAYIDHVHFTPDIDQSIVQVKVELSQLPAQGDRIQIRFNNSEQADTTYTIANTQSTTQTFPITLTNQRLWDLEDPFLYEVQVEYLGKAGEDRVNSYFGQRKISTIDLPGLGHPYIALNNKPIYLQLCLDQSYHPDGFYTFPSDEFMRNEILISKRLGLNGNRIHIKVEVPRKLYWADKLGVLIMADVPNFWGDPTDAARKDWEHCMRNQIKRDYNHPSIFAWVNFNETWGLFSNSADKPNRKYTKETQDWVRRMYHEAKALDPSRLVEDNSPCFNDHVETDINSWHAYCPGYEWDAMIERADSGTFVGSTWNFTEGNKQTRVPMMNSECGNVWGYEKSAGNSDFTWDYHIMMNAFRAHPKVCGWLYTEHHDVINEWNGYVQFDRSPKIDGLSDLVPGMTLRDFHSPYYISPRRELCTTVQPGEHISIPLFASFMTDRDPGELVLKTRLVGWNSWGEWQEISSGNLFLDFYPYMNRLTVDEEQVTMPSENGLYILQMQLCNTAGEVLHRNFVTFVVKGSEEPQAEKVETVTFPPGSFTAQQWSYKQWNVLNGLKVNGAGSGYFEYEIPWPVGCKVSDLASVSLRFEASAKHLFGKDREDLEVLANTDFMLGGGSQDPCKSPCSYAMTDLHQFESWVRISVNGKPTGLYRLEDDPADHRGILSWHSQLRDKMLREAGSYGYLVDVNIPLETLKEGLPINIRMEVPAEINHGMALYGKDFGRYPMDPTLFFIKK